MTNDLGQTFTYDAAGRQASSDFTNLQNSYDGDGLRVKRTQDGSYPALYLRSSVLGGQVVAEIDFVSGSWQWWRGYVYAGSQLLALQSGGVFFVHEDPVTKSKRVTNTSGVIQSTVELDPFGADTNKSSSSAFQPRKFTSYERDANGTDEAMFRRYNRWHSRFDQPDPYDGSYSLVNPQSFNRYAYVQGDPVNFVDPTGLDDFTISWWTNPDGSIGSSGFSLDGGTTYGGPQSVMIGGLGDRGFVVQVHLLSEAGLGSVGGGPQNPSPQGPAPGQKLSEEDCAKRIASLLGGAGSVASTQREPQLIDPKRAGSLRFPEHSAPGGIVHLFGNEQGTAPPNSVGLYVPAGFTAVPGGRGTVYNKPNEPNPGEVNYNYAQYRNSAGVTISFVHIGSPVGPARNAAGSTLVGSIAGPGGAGYGYNHTHINFYLNGKRTDPRSIFCK